MPFPALSVASMAGMVSAVRYGRMELNLQWGKQARFSGAAESEKGGVPFVRSPLDSVSNSNECNGIQWNSCERRWCDGGGSALDGRLGRQSCESGGVGRGDSQATRLRPRAQGSGVGITSTEWLCRLLRMQCPEETAKKTCNFRSSDSAAERQRKETFLPVVLLLIPCGVIGAVGMLSKQHVGLVGMVMGFLASAAQGGEAGLLHRYFCRHSAATLPLLLPLLCRCSCRCCNFATFQVPIGKQPCSFAISKVLIGKQLCNFATFQVPMPIACSPQRGIPPTCVCGRPGRASGLAGLAQALPLVQSSFGDIFQGVVPDTCSDPAQPNDPSGHARRQRRPQCTRRRQQGCDFHQTVWRHGWRQLCHWRHNLANLAARRHGGTAWRHGGTAAQLGGTVGAQPGGTAAQLGGNCATGGTALLAGGTGREF
eukprot:gene15027-biopygen1538